MLRTIQATRYVLPLREGGSLPAIVEADDLGLYVVKFRGAGQGILALIAELIAGEIGRALGLRVPELVFAQIDPALGRNEPDAEIRHLLKASSGLNLALDYLPGSTRFDPAARDTAPADEASLRVWLDAFVQNPDRTPATPTCSSGTASSTPSTTAPRSTSTTTGRHDRKRSLRPLPRSKSTSFCPGPPRLSPPARLPTSASRRTFSPLSSISSPMNGSPPSPMRRTQLIAAAATSTS